VRLEPHDDARYVAVSPDGRWVATGSHGASTEVKVWDARTGKPEKELPVESGATVGFSPDGKWLVTGDRGCRLWAVDTWRAGPHVDGVARTAFAFSPDGKLLAMEGGFGVVRLVDPDTGREFARLEGPDQGLARSINFSPDGTRLVAGSNDSRSVHVWDLRRIRADLAEMGLDWGLPPYPPPAHDARPALRILADRGNLDALLQAQGHYREGSGLAQSGQWGKAVAAYARAVESDPGHATALNNLAWLLATCPDVKCRDPGRAVELAARALNLTPQDGNAFNTLGVARYRAGDWPAAVAALTKSDELLVGKEQSFNAFFLAMAHERLGQRAEARTWHDRAVRWMDENKPKDEELRRFRAEAADLLEGSKKQ